MLNYRASVNAGQVFQVLQKHQRIRDVLPDKQELVFPNRILNELMSKPGPGRPSMFVDYAARWSQQAFPSTLPCLIGEIRILDIERVVERIKTTNGEVLVAVKSAGTATRPEDRNRFEAFFQRIDVIVPELEETAAEAGASLAGFFTAPGGVGEEDLGSNRENGRIVETVEEWFEEPPVHDHIVVQEHNEVRFRLSDSAIVSAGESMVQVQREDMDLRESGSHELCAAVRTAVVHDEDFVVAAIEPHGLQYRGKAFIEQMFAVPTDNDDR